MLRFVCKQDVFRSILCYRCCILFAEEQWKEYKEEVKSASSRQ